MPMPSTDPARRPRAPDIVTYAFAETNPSMRGKFAPPLDASHAEFSAKDDWLTQWTASMNAGG